MNKQIIRTQLQEIPLNFDNQTIQDAQNFLLNSVGIMADVDLKYQIFASVAIIAEQRKIPNLTNTTMMKTGIQIENVLTHLGQLSKEEFLNTIKRQLEKIKDPSQRLKQKVEEVRFSYRFYKKYLMAFNTLYAKSQLSQHGNQDFVSLFWILYLYVKNENFESENIGEAKVLLIVLLRSIFESFIKEMQASQVAEVLIQTIGSIPDISVEKYNFYFQLFLEKLNSIFQKRCSSKIIDFEKLKTNQALLRRIMDDLSNQYANNRSNLKYSSQIDQNSYLELKKVFKRSTFNVAPISKPLSFDDSDDQDQEQNPTESAQKTATVKSSSEIVTESVQRRMQKQKQQKSNILSPSSSSTPAWRSKPLALNPQNQSKQTMTIISNKISNQNWLKATVESVTTDILSRVQTAYQKWQGKPYAVFKQTMQEYKTNMISEFTPKCHNSEVRKSQIFKCFSYFLNQITQLSENEAQVLREPLIFQGIMCLTSIVYNYAKQSLNTQYKLHCQIYKVGLLESFLPLNLILNRIANQLPQDLHKFIMAIQKRLVIIDIWQTDVGFKVLCERLTQNIQNRSVMQAWKRIEFHTHQRVRQICKRIKIERKIQIKIINMIDFIFKEKFYLLKLNNIDQIVLCCIMSSLSINQKQEHQNLKKLFEQYNSSIPFSYNENQHTLRDSSGKTMNIVDYYNDVFVAQIQQILMNLDSNNADVLLTPIRLNYKDSFIKSSGKRPSAPSIRHLKQGKGSFSNQGQNLRKMSYGQSLLKNSQMNNQSDGNDSDDQDKLPSPSFGGLHKTFSFGGGKKPQ